MDRVGADFDRGVQTMVDRLGAVPCRSSSDRAEADFSGIIDLVAMRAVVYKDDLGKEWEETDIPADHQERAEEARTALIEAVAEYDDELMEDYLEGKEIEVDRLKADIRKATLDFHGGERPALTPVLCGSSFKNKGVQPLLDAVLDYLPEPARRARRSRASSRRRRARRRTPRPCASRRTTRRSPHSPSRSCPTRSSASSPTSACTRASSRPAAAC
jgi:translation elongation factor EF-G